MLNSIMDRISAKLPFYVAEIPRAETQILGKYQPYVNGA